jgi:hypothetical protein
VTRLSWPRKAKVCEGAPPPGAGPDGRHCAYSAADSKTLADARARGAADVRVSDVVLGDGSVGQWEVRFGGHAWCPQRQQGSATGMLQINLRTGTSQGGAAVISVLAAIYPLLSARSDVPSCVRPAGTGCTCTTATWAVVSEEGRHKHTLSLWGARA